MCKKPEMGGRLQDYLEIVHSPNQVKIGVCLCGIRASFKTLLKSLEPVQNAVLKLTLGAYRTSQISSLYCEAGIKPI